MFLLTLHFPAFPSSPPATMKVTGTTLRKRLGRLCSMPRAEESESFLRLISRKSSMWEFHSLCYVWVLCMSECVLFVWLCIALRSGLRHNFIQQAICSKHTKFDQVFFQSLFAVGPKFTRSFAVKWTKTHSTSFSKPFVTNAPLWA